MSCLSTIRRRSISLSGTLRSLLRLILSSIMTYPDAIFLDQDHILSGSKFKASLIAISKVLELATATSQCSSLKVLLRKKKIISRVSLQRLLGLLSPDNLNLTSQSLSDQHQRPSCTQPLQNGFTLTEICLSRSINGLT